MNEIVRNSQNLLSLCTLIVIVFYTNLTIAQPGWEDYTARYFYTILDKNGKEISFKSNKNYSIIIDSVFYKSPRIPQDSLKPAIKNSGGFEYHIRINDFSLAIPQKKYYESNKKLEIKIIHKKDTMYICQNSGIVAFRSFDFNNKQTKKSFGFTLQFIAGHYYFPTWAKNLLDNLPKTNGNVKFLNIDQRHFIVPKPTYDSVCFNTPKEDYRQKNYEVAEKVVVKNFMNGHFSLERSTQPTLFDISVRPFKNPRWSTWGSSYFSTKNKEEYLGVVQLSYDTLNYSGGRGLITKYNFKENKMNIWSATKKLMYSSSYRLRKDPFNNVFYNQTILRDSTCQELIYNCDFVTKFYRSSDEGNNWEVSDQLTQLATKHGIRELEFLDKNQAILFKLEKIKQKNKNYDIQQGTYYLLNNFRIVDSLKTPDDIDYNGNDNRYQYRVKNDTVFIGSWSYSEFQKEKPYFQPYLIKSNNHWKFQVEEKTFFRTQPDSQMDTITYQNFKILNNQLYLNNESGSLVFQNDFTELHKRGLILEKGKQIYIIGLGIGTLVSFDGGYNWYVYPLPLEKDSRYEFLEIDEQGVISHLKNSWVQNGYEFNKVFNQFIKIDE